MHKTTCQYDRLLLLDISCNYRRPKTFTIGQHILHIDLRCDFTSYDLKAIKHAQSSSIMTQLIYIRYSQRHHI